MVKYIVLFVLIILFVSDWDDFLMIIVPSVIPLFIMFGGYPLILSVSFNRFSSLSIYSCVEHILCMCMTRVFISPNL